MKECSKLREPTVLAATWRDTQELGFKMASEPLGCSILRGFAATKPVAKILELGSGLGVSTTWLPDGLDAQSRLTKVNHDPAVLNVLRKYFGCRLAVACSLC